MAHIVNKHNDAIMKTNPLTVITLILLGIFGLYGASLIAHNQEGAPAPFKIITPTDYTGLIGWLFVVALFVERAIEVVVMVVRDQQSDLLGDQADQAAKALATATQQTNALPPGDQG
jgi:hypothetical protein